jgi:hypothetical protein
MIHLMGWKVDLKTLPSTYRTPSNSLYSVRSDAWNLYHVLVIYCVRDAKCQRAIFHGRVG